MMAFIRVIALALALAASSAWSSHPSESARNQYEAREDRPQPQLLTEATDHRPEVHMSASINNSTNGNKQLTPDLQVGCGDGFIHEKGAKSESDKYKKKRVRRRRSYTPWSSQITYQYSEPYQSISVWRPSVYPLSRPYFIPIYGVPGRIPLYFPPQPLLVNPGVPKENPKPPFKGPTYLPPDQVTTPSTTTMKIEDRWLNGGDNSDDKPIWSDGNDQRPATTTEVVPTRATRPPGFPKVPPLIHKPTDPQDFEVPPESEIEATAPPPPPRTPPPPASNQAVPAPSNEPSRCVWAIISCCSTSNEISYDCFDQRGCPGAFWDQSPCDSEFARAAIAAALNYYNKK